MAQLDVERKPHNSMWWLWLLIGLLIVLTIWWFIWGPGGGVVIAAPAEGPEINLPVDSVVPPVSSALGSGGAVSIFQDFARGSRADSMSIDHEHTATGLRELAAAGEALAMSSTNSALVDARADSLRTFADQVERDPASTRHAEITRRAFIVGASMMRDALPVADSSRTAAMMGAAESIVPATGLLEQRSAVQRYWDAAEVAITNRGGSGS